MFGEILEACVSKNIHWNRVLDRDDESCFRQRPMPPVALFGLGACAVSVSSLGLSYWRRLHVLGAIFDGGVSRNIHLNRREKFATVGARV